MKKILLFVFLTSFFCLANAQIYMDSDGLVGIGEEEPAANLEVVGRILSDTIDASMIIGDTLDIDGNITADTIDADAMFGENLTITPSTSEAYGIYSYLAWSTESYKRSIYGYTRAQNNTYNFGIYGLAVHSSTQGGRSFGVHGTAAHGEDGYNYGVYGMLSGTGDGAAICGSTTYNYGIDIDDRYAGYFDGDVKVDGEIIITGDGWVNGTELIFSDTTLKKDIKNLTTKYQNLINIKGISFKYDYQKIEEIRRSTIPQSDTGNFVDIDKEYPDRTTFGLNAQEVQSIYPELVSEDKNGLLGVNYNGFIPLLVDAVNSLTSSQDSLKTIIQSQEQEILQLNDRVDQLMVVIGESSISKGTNGGVKNKVISQEINSAILYQNNPNPFTDNTTIGYYIPDDISKAFINIYSMSGEQLKRVELYQKGVGNIIINGGEFIAGMYMYALITDGQLIDTKRMILTD